MAARGTVGAMIAVVVTGASVVAVVETLNQFHTSAAAVMLVVATIEVTGATLPAQSAKVTISHRSH